MRIELGSWRAGELGKEGAGERRSWGAGELGSWGKKELGKEWRGGLWEKGVAERSDGRLNLGTPRLV
jgi:hypothetical protein